MCAAQTVAPPDKTGAGLTLGGRTGIGLLERLMAGTGPLIPLSGQPSDTSPTTGTKSSASTANMKHNAASRNAATMAIRPAINSVLKNPLMSYGLMVFDNLKRALMAPYMSRFGNTAGCYWLTNGADKFTKVALSDLLAKQMATPTGMNPFMSSWLTGNMMDAPDSYIFNKMMLDSMIGQNQNTNNLPNFGRSGGGNFLTQRNKSFNPMLLMWLTKMS